jgi:ABC-type uncharacterized transport system substrate-binding protein
VKRRSVLALLGTSSLSAITLSAKGLAQTPKPARVGVLIGAGSDASDYALEAFRLGLRDQGFTEGKNLSIERQIDREGSEESLARAAKLLAEWSPDVVLVANTPPALQKLGALTTGYRLPFCGDRLLEVRGGLLMSYGPNVAAEFRQAAGIVGRILHGADPATLPVEPPQRFELALNEATAKKLGIVFPASVRARANAVIDF